MSTSTMWLLFFLVMTFFTPSLSLTAAKVQEIVPAIETLINNSFDPTNTTFEHPVLGTLLRLAFHDCAGQDGCDGCLNASLPENGGLDDVIDLLEGIYQGMALNASLTRADFWALSGIVAVNVGIRNVPGRLPVPPKLHPMNFTWGRKDCASGDPTNTTDKSSDFPSAMLGPSGVLSFFQTRFNFNAVQTVAIMGAHNLGRAHAVYSGFNDSWTANGMALGSEYYANMANAGFGWVQAAATNGNLQWQPSAAPPPAAAPRPGSRPPPPPPKVMMLDADMALYKSIGTPAANGQAQCPYSACRLTAQTSSQVNKFAMDTRAFLTAFEDAFTRMLAVCGRPNGKITPCSLSKLQ